jgi:hypothetical protein
MVRSAVASYLRVRLSRGRGPRRVEGSRQVTLALPGYSAVERKTGCDNIHLSNSAYE